MLCCYNQTIITVNNCENSEKWQNMFLVDNLHRCEYSNYTVFNQPYEDIYKIAVALSKTKCI